MKEIILGTAGHIDHGKTSLVRALTGVNTDRLKEEKKRNITIDLGFAALELENGRRLGVVDVPGHEKFVKNMVAGASGIDIVLMLIASDEGIMPQTREHMEICSLLGIKQGIIVLSKKDMVDEEWLEMVKEDVREFSRGTFLEKASIIPLSSHTGEGLDLLLKEISLLAEKIPDIKNKSIFRLPVDRVFSMKGFGSVITGTLISGSVSTGENIMIYPSMLQSKVRGLQVHNKSVEKAVAGQRTALNFQGLELAELMRGDIIAGVDSLKNTYMIDSVFHYLSSNEKNLKNRSRLRFHIGTSEISANCILLDREVLKPGEKAVVQFRFDRAISCLRDDAYVVRSYSPVRTIGGGLVLNPLPQKHRPFQEEIVEGIKLLEKAESAEIIDFHLLQAKTRGADIKELRLVSNLSEKELLSVIQKLLTERRILLIDREAKKYIHGKSFDELSLFAVKHLGNYHKKYPLKEGISKEELKSKFPSHIGERFLNQLLNQLLKDEGIVQNQDIVRLKDHKVALKTDEKALQNKILKTYKERGLTPPYFKEIVSELDKAQAAAADDVLKLLIRENKIVKVKEELYFDKEALEGLKEKTISFFEEKEDISPAEFKTVCGGIARKYVIPLMEYFDKEQITIRVGDTRKLRKQRSK